MFRTLLAYTLLSGLVVATAAQGEELLISNPAELRALEKQGLDFTQRVGPAKVGGHARTLAELAAHPGFGNLTAEIDRQLASEKEVLQGMRPDYDGLVRFFGERWLRSPDASFRLTAVVGRPDRMIQSPETCGEVRLLYRLGYRTTLKSRVWDYQLPMTLSLVYQVAQSKGIADCAAKWKRQGINTLVKSIADGSMPLVRVETNLQLSRWAYTAKSRFSDQVHYLLLAFAVEKNAWRTQELENTPDVTRLEGDSKLRDELRSWLADPQRRPDIESGRVQVPKQFLAKVAVSVSPYHLARKSNRPYTALYGRQAGGSTPGLGALDKDLLARLDGMTCQGCHQSHGTAGFHFLGEHQGKLLSNIFLMSGRSLHFNGALAWRQKVYGSKQWFGDVPVPRAERLGIESGSIGDFCEPQLVTCRSDLRCQPQYPSSDLVTGICLPTGTADGNPCDDGDLKTSSNPLFDRWSSRKSTSCPVGSFCAESDHGFPQGLCSRRCEVGKDQGLATICVPVPQLGPYETCLNDGRHFSDCAGEFSIPSVMTKCAGQQDCRPDYGCFGKAVQAGRGVAGGSKEMAGFCAPIYVDPELTVEHHPLLR